MNKLLLILLISTLVSCGIKYSTTSIAPLEASFESSGTKAELYVESANWMAEQFGDSDSVIEFMDKEAGIITGKYVLNTLYGNRGVAIGNNFALIRLQVRDGSSKITIKPYPFTEMFVPAGQEDPIYGKDESQPLSYVKEDAIADMEELLWSYQEYLENQDF